MSTLEVKSKTYALDDDGSLIDPMQWDEDFAEAMAPRLGIPDGLTPSHLERAQVHSQNLSRNRYMPDNT